MKGGITSGVVYPPAILELSERYRFRSIGGASAGAIAAAAAAAAEYGRQEGKESSGAGFKRLKQMQDQLGESGFLLKLFQPSEEVRPLFELALALKKLLDEKPAQEETGRKRSPLMRGLRLVHQVDELLQDHLSSAHRFGSTAGAALAALLLGPWVWLAVRWGLTDGLLPKLVALAVLMLFVLLCWLGYSLGAVAGSALGLWKCTGQLRDSRRGTFGLCDGSRGCAQGTCPPDASQSPYLTDWLATSLNELAGKDGSAAPLTMGELKKHGIQFEVVTSNLSQALPYTLPLKRDTRSLYFRRSDMEALFPQNVVNYLVQYGQSNVPGRVILPDGFYRFPAGDNLPVLVATRMSLSFPVLLSAMRLYAVKHEAFLRGKKNAKAQLSVEDMVPMVFSDGGIASNFPIHLFDAWLPDRPSFGITLYDSPITGTLKTAEGTNRWDVLLPTPRDTDSIRPQVKPITSLPGLLIAALDTAQSYRDNLQSSMPGFRERVAQVFLKGGEGGLNLDMQPETIAALGQRGRKAARQMIAHFSEGKGMSFSQHLWVRMLVQMAQLEKEVFSIRNMRRKAGADWRRQLLEEFQGLTIEQLNARQDPKTAWYRPQRKEWCDEAVRRLDALMELVEKWDKMQEEWRAHHKGADYFFAANPPHPEGLLRVRPEL